jgi:excisionase family DNA binding protein
MSKLLRTGSSSQSPGTPVAQLEPLLTVDEVADHLRLSSRTIRRLIAAKKLAVVRIGRAVRVRAEAVEALVSGQEVTGEDNNGQG